MALICSLCNEVPETPVISPISGHIFEKRLIEKYLSENGTDPINGEPLSVDMLVEVKTTHIVKPKPPSATSIPAILKSLQDEWDAVMLHGFTLRQQLQTARQELSHALYQHDAACRVIARLTKEVTAAREALATLKPQAAAAQAAGLMPLEGSMTPGPQTPQHTPGTPSLASDAGNMNTTSSIAEEIGMSDDVILRLQEKASLLTAERKRRGKSVPEGLTSAEDMRGWRQIASHVGLHSASTPGILCLDVCQRDPNRLLTGGNDRNAVVFNKETEQMVAILRGHTKKVTSVVYHPSEDLAFSASPDATIRVWGVAQAQCAAVIRAHQSAVTGLSLHATGDYLLSSGADAHWALSDIRTGRVLVKAADPQNPQALTCCQFHPDGLILGTGTSDAQVKIWDLKERRNVANFASHTGAITALSFSENGYYLATAAEDGIIKLWDLRKLKNFKSLTGCEEVRALTFDQSGSFLAAAGTDVRLFQCKQWQEVRVFNDHTATATGVGFGGLAGFLVTSSIDRSIKVFGQ